MSEEETLNANLKALVEAINAQQAFADDDKTKTSYVDLDAAMAPIGLKIGLVQAMSSDVTAMGTRVTETSANLTKQIQLFDQGRKKWRDEAKLLHKKLEDKATAKITAEQADMVTTQETLQAVRCDVYYFAYVIRFVFS